MVKNEKDEEEMLTKFLCVCEMRKELWGVVLVHETTAPSWRSGEFLNREKVETEVGESVGVKTEKWSKNGPEREESVIRQDMERDPTVWQREREGTSVSALNMRERNPRAREW